MQRIWKDAYNYDPETKEYLGTIRAFASPADLQKGLEIYHLPGNSTYKIPPEVNENQIAVFDEWIGEWTIADDYRQKVFWDIRTKEPVKLQLGEKPDFATMAKTEPSGCAEYDGQYWIEKPAEDDILRPYEWNSETKAWQKKKLPLQGSEIAAEIKRLILLENIFELSISQKLSISDILNKYLDVLSYSSSISKEDYDNLLNELLKEFGRKLTKASKATLTQRLDTWLEDKEFGS